jgi:hypothetical protein
MLSKAVRSFAINMLEDEKYVEKRGATYINIWIRKIHLTGKVGEVEPDVNESFPISWAQKRDMILQLFQSGNEDVGEVLRHPENAGLIALIIGVPELYIPGDDDRNKQLVEIGEMILAEPVPAPSPMMPPPQGQPGGGEGPALPAPEGPPEGEAPPMSPGMPGDQAPGGPAPGMGPGMMLTSSVRIEPTLDNHQVEMITCQAWLKSDVGLQYKKENPGAYLNVLLHMQEHQKFVTMAEAAAPDEEEGEDGEKKKKPPKE